MRLAAHATGTARMIGAIDPADIVLEGGHAKKLEKLPKDCRLGNNDYAFARGFRLSEDASRSGRRA
jgi:hypothetical protein